MNVQIQKIYNLPRHSYLLLLCVTGLVDNCVFVVKDLGTYLPPAPEGSSSASPEDPPVEGEESSSSDSSGMPDESTLPGEETEDCEVLPNTALYAIASLEDMLYAPKGPSESRALYRSAAVGLMFKSKEALEQTLEEIIADLRILRVLLKIPIVNFETVEFEDDNDAVDESTIYWMPEE